MSLKLECFLNFMTSYIYYQAVLVTYIVIVYICTNMKMDFSSLQENIGGGRETARNTALAIFLML